MHKGIQINLKYNYSLGTIYREILQDTLAFQILQEILFDEAFNIQDLAYKFHASISSVYRTIVELNQYFKAFNVMIKTNPCQVIGDETYIRKFYRSFFKEAHTPLEWPFRDYDGKDFDENFTKIIRTLVFNKELDDNFLDFAFYRSIKLMVMVSIIRYRHGHFVDTTNYQSFLYDILINGIRFFVLPKSLLQLKNTSVSKEYVYQIFYPYLDENIAFGQKSLLSLQKKHPYIQDAITYLETSLQRIVKSLGIAIDLPPLVLALYGTVSLEDHDPNDMYILYKRHLIFNNSFKKDFPTIYKNIHEMIRKFRQLLQKDDDGDKTGYLIFTLINNWENLLPILFERNQKISLLVVSDEHLTHAESIKGFLSTILPKHVQIDCYKNRDFSVGILNNLNYDLFITTFPIRQPINLKTVAVSDFLYPGEIERIQLIVSALILEKSNKLKLD